MTARVRTMARPVVVHADWDPEAAVWVATTRDVNGLVTEAESIEQLRAKLPGMILDLLEENGITDVPASIEIIARASDRLDAAAPNVRIHAGAPPDHGGDAGGFGDRVGGRVVAGLAPGAGARRGGAKPAAAGAFGVERRHTPSGQPKIAPAPFSAALVTAALRHPMG